MGWIKNIKEKRMLKIAHRVADYMKQNNITFSFSKSKDQLSTPEKQTFTRPAAVDWTDQLVANESLLRGIYHNSYPGMKLAGCFAKKPINTPIKLMGLPIPKCEDKKIQELLNEFIADNSQTIQAIHTECHLIGTVAIWPYYDIESKKVKLEFIPDRCIMPLVKDIKNGEIVKLITEEQIGILSNNDQITYVKRKRIFAKDKITVIWQDTGGLRDLNSEVYRNPIGMLPIIFTNNKGADEDRGHSDYENIISDLKNYHDVDLAYSKALSKFSIKLVHTLAPGGTPETWKTNNGISSLANLDIYTRDLFVNMQDEKDEFIFPNGAFDAYEKKLNITYWKIVQGSNIPEIFWGLNAAGNHASVEDSHNEIVEHTKGKQDQHTQNYIKLFTAITSLYSIATMNNSKNIITVEWNKLDALDEKTKMIILKDFTTAIGAIIKSASGTLEQVYNLWNELYPQLTEYSYDEWRKKIDATAKHNSFNSANYEMIMDLEGSENIMIDDDGEMPEFIPGMDDEGNNDQD